jgi:hypothetical protein
MPNTASHLAVAGRNGDLIQHLTQTKDRHSEWLAVVAFYKALHLVDAMLFCDHPCKHGGDHTERARILKVTQKYQNIYRNFRPLSAASCVARYLATDGREYSAFAAYLSPDQVMAVLINHHLKQVEDRVTRILESRGVSIAP